MKQEYYVFSATTNSEWDCVSYFLIEKDDLINIINRAKKCLRTIKGTDIDKAAFFSYGHFVQSLPDDLKYTDPNEWELISIDIEKCTPIESRVKTFMVNVWAFENDESHFTIIGYSEYNPGEEFFSDIFLPSLINQ